MPARASSPDSSKIDAKEIAAGIIRAANESGKNEENLRIRVEQLLRSAAFDKLGIEWAQYEFRTRRVTTLQGRDGRIEHFTVP